MGIVIKPYKAEYLGNVLALSNRSVATERSVDTWDGNDMTAVLAYDSSALVGAIPLEKRIFCLGNSRYINVLWVTGAYVEDQYRRQGIGTAMDNRIAAYFPEFKAGFVYRHDEHSSAYKWYRQMGYYELLPILALKKEVTPHISQKEYVVLGNAEKLRQWEGRIYDCFAVNSVSLGGFPQRDRCFWSHKLKAHYYKKFYDYNFILLTGSDNLSAYAFLGRTDMKDGIERLDILEMAAPDDISVLNALYSAIMDFAYKNKLHEIRIQVSIQDKRLTWIESLGFAHRWRTNILGKLFSPVGYFTDRLAEKVSLEKDYQFIIQTPALGRCYVGKGKSSVSIFADDNIFTQMLLGRCDVCNAINEKRITIIDGAEENIRILEECFPLSVWRYHQIDYI